MKEMWPWITLVLLGAYHGINPGMGWLFAVALGLQERTRKAVVRAFAPIALGHAASVAMVVGLVVVLQAVVSPALLRGIGGGALIAFGLYKLLAPMSHPRWVGMRVGFRDLAAWSFLMATAHGAGLMLVPVLMKLPSEPVPSAPTARVAAASPAARIVTAAQEDPAQPACHPQPKGGVVNTADEKPVGPAASSDAMGMSCHTAGAGISGTLPQAGAVALHTLAMFLTMAGVAIVVYEKVGLAILRRAWINLDLLWAGALIGAGVLTFLL